MPQLNDPNSATVKKPCCTLLKKLSLLSQGIIDPDQARETLVTLSQHCSLISLMGKAAVQWDLSKSNCYLAVNPDEAQPLVTDIEKIVDTYPGFKQYHELISHLNGLIAHNGKLKQLSNRNDFVQEKLREFLRSIAPVPPPRDPDRPSQHSELGTTLETHPFMKNKTQFQGMPDKTNPSPVQNSDAAKNAEALQNRLEHSLTASNQKRFEQSAAPTLKRPGG